MGRKRKHVDYRQLYKDYYHIEFGPEMVVHHIDFNRDNNSIDNLLLLPNRLHAKYHFTLQTLTGLHGELNLTNELQLTTPMVTIHYSMWLRNMAEVLEEVKPWIHMKYDYEMLPASVFQAEYHTDRAITERSVR